MRPQQQNRRMRGRGNNNNNNNRKGPNPLTRSYESNGPDVKIRGTAQQIADKYSTLARDLQSSGDRVTAENYLQHAEHYNRIIAAAQAQQQQQQQNTNRDGRDDSDDDDDDRSDYNGGSSRNGRGHDDNDHQHQQNAQSGDQSGNRSARGDRGDDRASSDHDQPNGRGSRERRSVDDGSGPQPVIEGMPAEIALTDQETSRKSANGRRRPRADKPAAEASDQANGAGAETNGAEANGAAAHGGEEEGARKRPRRPRRARATGEEAAETGDAARDDQGGSTAAGN